MSTLSPPREAVTERQLWLGSALGPAAWALHSLVGYFLAARSCAVNPTGWGEITPGGLRFILFGLALLMLLAALTGLLLSLRNWRATGGEGSLFEAEGRTRPNFMALFGIIVSAVFAIGLLYNAIAPLLLEPCVHTA
jgi:hypothetical protein